MELDIYTHSDRQWEKEFLANYSLDAELFEKMNIKIKQIVPVRSVFRIATDKGFFCLKKLRFPLAEMYFIMEAVEHLKENGFKNIFNIVEQKDGSLFLEHNKDKYFLTEWIDGRECDYLNPMDLKAAVEVMAELHNLSKGFNPVYCPDKRNYLGCWHESFQKKIIELKHIYDMVHTKDERNEFDNMFLENVDGCISSAKMAADMLKGTKYDELVEQARRDKSFIHHDFAHHNIIHTFDGKTYVVDFDFCMLDIRIHDLGSLIIRNMKKCNWDVDKALFIIDIYNKKNTLSDNEIKVLIPFFLFPQDFWQLSRQYYIEKKAWDEEDYIDKMNKKSEYSDMRRMFLEEFIKRI